MCHSLGANFQLMHPVPLLLIAHSKSVKIPVLSVELIPYLSL